MPTADEFVVAIDAGGTHTRVGCFQIDGTLLSRVEGPGGGPHHNHQAAEHVSATITAALAAGNLDPHDAIAMTAGIAGYELNQANEWADHFFDGSALRCPRQLVNDAVIAHRGALAGEAGIIVVAGTGSMILAITEDEQMIGTGRFQHYAGGARHLVYDLIHHLLIGDACEADQNLLNDVLTWCEVDDLAGLRQSLLKLSDRDYNELKHRYGGLAPTITAAADQSPLADTAVRGLAQKTAIGVRVLAPLIKASPVPVALSGSLATAPAFARRFTDALADGRHGQSSDPDNVVVTPALEPLGGAALLALESVGIPAESAIVERLQLAGN